MTKRTLKKFGRAPRRAVHVRVEVGFAMPYQEEDRIPFEAALRDICKSSFDWTEEESISLKIRFRPISDFASLSLLPQRVEPYGGNVRWCSTEMTLRVNKPVFRDEKEFTTQKWVAAMAVFANHCVTTAISGIAVAARIAHPTANVHLLETRVYVGGALVSTAPCKVPGRGWGCAEPRPGWPPVGNLAIAKVWKWMFPLPGFSCGVSEDRLGRALNAFTYALVTPVEATTILWCVTALEALLCRGERGKQEQLIERVGALFGMPDGVRKRIRQLYDLRSRLVHGDADLPSALREGGGHPREVQYDQAAWGAQELAEALLLAVFQYMTKHRTRELNFKVSVDRAQGGRDREIPRLPPRYKLPEKTAPLRQLPSH